MSKLSRRFILPYLLAFSLSASPALAEDFQLFGENGRPVENYDRIVEDRIKTGDTLTFADGRRFLVNRRLKYGGYAAVFEVQELQEIEGEKGLLKPRTALKLPNENIPDLREAIDTQVGSFLDLQGRGVSVPQIRGHLRGQYVNLDFVEHDFSGREFFLEPGRIAPEKLAAAEAALEEFARGTSKFADIGDFRMDQFVYSSKTNKWTLLDWTSASQVFDPSVHLPSANAFDRIGSEARFALMKSNRLDELGRANSLISRLKGAIQSQRQARAAGAATVTLFDRKGSQVSRYNFLLAELEPGDVLAFSDGARFRYERVLSLDGGTTAVLQVREILPSGEIRPATVLRVPKASGNFNARYTYQAYIDRTRDGYGPLVKAGVPVPKIHRSLSRQYVNVEFISPDIRFDEFFTSPHKFDPETLRKAEEALVDFARRSASFAQVGDFKPEQIVYDASRDQWVLLDWQDNHARYAFRRRAVNVFADWMSATRSYEPAQIERELRIRARVLEAIESTRAPVSWKVRCILNRSGLISLP